MLDMSQKKSTKGLLAATICSNLLIITAVIMCLLDISLLRTSKLQPNPGPTVLHTIHAEDKTLHEMNKLRCEMRTLIEQ